MSDEKILKLLEEHERRIAVLEAKLAGPTPKGAPGDRKTLPDHVLALRDQGFFAEAKTGDDVHKKLMESYHCEKKRVDVCLLRMSKARQLRRASKVIGEKKLIAYAW